MRTTPAHLSAAREAIAALGVNVHVPNEAIGVDAARLRQRHRRDRRRTRRPVRYRVGTTSPWS
jgi:hypothetical protein